MPGLDQFSERIMALDWIIFDDSRTPGTFYSTGNVTADTRIDVIQLVNTDSIDHHMSVDYIHGDGSALSCIITIPAGSGVGAVPCVDLLAFIAPSTQHFIWLSSGNGISATLGEAVNTGKQCSLQAWGGSF